MTGLQLSVLRRACEGTAAPGMRGTALLYEHQAGRIRQVNRLLKMGLVKVDGGRLVGTRDGKRVLKFHDETGGI